MSGFIALHREATTHHLFDGDAQRFGAWCWMVARAVWKPTKFDLNGKTITLERGQMVASRSQLAKAWGMKESAVERFLTRLQTEQMIERATGQGRSIITICNYSKYQDPEAEAGQATGQATGQRSDSDRTAKEQGNKGTIVEEDTDVSPSTARGASAKPFDRPEWADPQVWSDFLRNRKTKRLSNTATAYRRFIADISALADPEWPPGRLLEAIVARGWGAAFDPRPKQGSFHDRSNQPPRDNRDGFVRALDRRMEAVERHPPGETG